jgi:hypothetical protein
MPIETAVTPWRTKEAMMRWHSYQSLVLRARIKAQW